MVVHRIDYSSPLAPPRPTPFGLLQPPPTPSGGWSDFPSPQAVKDHLQRRPYLEVLVLLSGTEDATASSIEARHSYTLEEIFWNRNFASCVSIDSEGIHCINFARMHKTYSLPEAQAEGTLPRAAHGHSRRSFPATYEGADDSPLDDLSCTATANANGLDAAGSVPDLSRLDRSR
eukprot:CAMPEP_0170216826 /NCGR_PEP_ID=MMETSP0116_2-20130129/8076_1 /TAXON_ID=400756 /ORGANISM="Durinskia baltica, Strain CSIRO CS-38" /LENGTH=174 /DNA_ID=CAMNT_0010467455 /DNA_START=14 /DNA_END=534 /DNA_ORIENTATION=+